MPFVLVATQGSLEYLRSYGFKTFNHLWDESYNDIEDDHERISAVGRLLAELDAMSSTRKYELFRAAKETIEHNWNHFYHGGVEAVLWQELKSTLNEIAPCY